MSAKKGQIKMPDGTIVTAVDLDFKIESDPETVIKLNDESVLKMRLSVTKVSRLEGINDPVTGDPVYYVQHQPVIRVDASPKLKKLK